MKKGILLIASAAALVLGSNNAFAAAPNWYNFQGVCLEQNATVTVQFDIVNANNDVIYSETHSGVKTNASGIFTLHVGEGQALEGAMPTEPELNAGGLSLVTTVNGLEVSNAPFGKVPYAAYAESVGPWTIEDFAGLATTITELTETISNNADAIYEISSDVQGIQDALQQKAPITMVTGLQEYVMEQIGDEGVIPQTITWLNKAIDDIEANYVTTEQLDKDMAGFQENIEMALAAYVTTEHFDSIVDGISSDVQGLMEVKRDFTPITKFNELQEYVMEQIGDEGVIPQTITWLNKAIDDIEANYVTTEQLDKDMAGFQENIEMALKAYATTEDLEASKKDLDDALGSIERNSNLISQLQSKVAEHIDEYQTNIDDLFGANERQAAQITDLQNKVTLNQESIDNIEGELVNLAGIQNTITTLQTKVAALEAALEAK